MKEIDTLFFELIRIAIGTQDNLSRLPYSKEWKLLYEMAKKQSIVGICFAGIQRLGADADDGFARIGLPEMLYLKWMGMAAKILQKNQTVDEQCVILGKMLKAEGYKYTLLKGQGVGQLYAEHLIGLRQSGDIDVLMWKEGMSDEKNRKAVIAYAHSIDQEAKASEHHVAVKVFKETEVEMHYAPAYMCNPVANRRFRQWSERMKVNVETLENLEIDVPCVEFNIVFMLAHTFRHYMSEGVGLRQLMDYYFVLRTSPVRGERLEIRETLRSLNMLKFAGSVMWVMKEVFEMSEFFLICEPNERLGRKLLAHVMKGGNFGHHNTETVASKASHVGRFVNQLVQDMKLAVDYPGEALWAPLSMIREFVRIRI